MIQAFRAWGWALAVCLLSTWPWAVMAVEANLPAKAAGAVATPARIAVISIELAQQPTLMRRAAARLAPQLAIDLYGLGGGHLPGLEGVDLAAYDLVVVEGVGPRLAQYRSQLDAVGQRTRVLVLNGREWIQGNVDADQLPDAIRYWRNATEDNYVHLFEYLATRLWAWQRPDGAAVPRPVEYAELAYYHPDHASGFTDLAAYLQWMQQRHVDAKARPRVGILFYRSLALSGDVDVIDALIRETEKQGGLPLALWRGESRDSLRGLLGADGRPAVDVLILCASQIDYADHRVGVAQAQALGVAVLNCTTDYSRDPAQWRADLGGFAPDRSGQLAMSETNGIVEPMMVGARVVGQDGSVRHQPLAEQVSWRVARAMAWANLHRAPNAEKRLVVTYHSEAADQADVGSDPDTYLDAQASLAALLRRLQQEGYDVGADPLPDAQQLALRMARDGSNTSAGLWGDPSHAGQADVQAKAEQAELNRRLQAGSAIAIPEAQYLDWYARLPAPLREQTEARWGPPPGRLMVQVDAVGKRVIVIPVLRFGKVVLAPHPVWGYLQDAGALASTGELPPHHQYIAFYLWMAQGEQADAYVPFFTQLSLMPGKQQGPSHDDWIGRLIADLPHIQPTPLQANGGIGNKRRAQAVTLGFMPPLAQAGLSPDLLALQSLLQTAGDATGDAADAGQQALRQAASSLERELGMNPMTASWPVLQTALHTYLAEIETAIMPVGGHVLGQAPDAQATAAMVQAMLAGDMTTAPDLATVQAVLQGEAGDVAPEVVTRIQDYAARIATAPREMDALLEALSGRYLEPGPMADAVRNPDALPPGRNPYTLATRRLPTPQAWETGAALADALIENYQQAHGEMPRKVAFVLWSGESTQHEGAMEAQILRLLGAKPVWNPRGEVIDVVLEDRASLGRPRVDVLVTTSGTYRDHFRDKIAMLAKAARLAAQAREDDNPVYDHSQTQARLWRDSGLSPEEAERRAQRRIYSTAPGAYSPSTQFAIRAGAQWDDARLSQLYTDRLGHAYGEADDGAADAQGFIAQLSHVEAAVFSRSSNTYGLLDTSMPAAYLGGIGMAVREQTGRQVENYVADLKSAQAGQARLEPLARTFGRELQSRYFNPAWIQAMQESGYNGARYMADLPAHMLLWDVTTPTLVSDADWAEVKAVYVDDKYQLGLEEYFEQHNPHARQHLLESMLDAIDRGAWQAEAADRAQLMQALAQSVASHGSDCALPSCAQQVLARMEAPAPAMANAPITSASSEMPPSGAAMAQVEGYALTPRPTVPVTPPQAPLMRWVLLAAVLLILGVGGLFRPRW